MYIFSYNASFPRPPLYSPSVRDSPKPISLRSLWRRSLVILSLLALVFAACSNDTTDNGGNNNPGGPVTSGRTPVSAQILNYPSAEYGFDGLPVDLTGTRLQVIYSDNSSVFVTNTQNMQVIPAIYDATLPSQTLYYTEGNRTVPAGALAFNGGNSNTDNNNGLAWVIPLLDIHYTGNLYQQEYYIDEVPTFRGVTVEGVYGSGTPGADDQTQNDRYHKVIPLAEHPEYYQWGWIWNSEEDAQGTGTGYVGDHEGILVKIGSMGNMSPGDGVIGGGGGSQQLKGLRLPVTKIYQVETVEYAVEPTFSDPIFIDDPSLIGDEFDIERWKTDVLSEVRVRVTYKDAPAPKEWTVSDMYTINPYGSSGKEGAIWTTPVLEWYSADELASSSLPGNVDTTDAGDWAVWAAQREPRLNVEYYGRTDYVVVPIYDKLKTAGVTIVSRSGEPIVMNGLDAVNHKPDGFDALMDYAKVTAVYTLKANTPGNFPAEMPRDDVWADIEAGTCRPGLFDGTDCHDLADILIKDNVDRYLSRGQGRDANITFYLLSTDDDPMTSLGNRRAKINLGMVGYGSN